jgi:Flp pilus assembly protein TadB
MKELTDNELVTLAWENLAMADKHLYSTLVLMIIVLIQSILLMFSIVNIFSFLIVYPICFLLYLYHRKKQEKYMNVVTEVLDELTSRGI